tara:strand:- start:366 stop:1913 length:1548 start_codon:yes stop_codon:yes gene_type:complete
VFDLTYIGHAGWMIRKEGFKAIFDPWFNPNGTFLNSWHQFPDNSHIFRRELFDDLDFLYISHAHHDHCDLWTLERIDKQTTIVIPRFRDKTLKNTLQELGFVNIIQLPENREKQFGQVRVQMIIEEGFNDRDSGIVLDDGENKIINLNDCHPSFEKIKKYSKNVDLLLLQCSSAIWWPCVYDYDYDELIEKCKIKKRNVLSRAVQYGRHVKPKYLVPNAGPPLFLHEEFEFWDKTRREDFNPFPLHDEIHSHLIENGIPSLFVIPGSTVSLKNDVIKNYTDIQERDKIYENLMEYILNQREEKKQKKRLEGVSLPLPNMTKMIEKFSSLIQQIKRESIVFAHKIDFPVLIEFEEHSKWIIDFTLDDKRCFEPYSDQDYMYGFVFNPSIVNYLINKKQIDFDEYFLSMRFKCFRKKDSYNEFLFTMFKNLDIESFKLSENIFLTNSIKKVNNLETFEIEVGGKKRRIQKYCPHKHVDLEKCGIIEGETIVCPLHNWKFDLNSGKCLTSDKYKLELL